MNDARSGELTCEVIGKAPSAPYSAPEESKRALQELQQTFGFLPNLAGAMAESPVLLDSFVGVFQKVHPGHFTEAEIQALLLTNAVTHRSA